MTRPHHTPDREMTESREIVKAAQALIDKLAIINEETAGIFALAANHGFPYQGPTYAKELEALQSVLASLPAPVSAASDGGLKITDGIKAKWRHILSQGEIPSYGEYRSMVLACLDDLDILCPETSTDAMREAAAKFAEQEVETYNEGMSAVDVRLSYTHGPKWKNGPAIAKGIRALPLPAPSVSQMSHAVAIELLEGRAAAQRELAEIGGTKRTIYNHAAEQLEIAAADISRMSAAPSVSSATVTEAMVDCACEAYDDAQSNDIGTIVYANPKYMRPALEAAFASPAADGWRQASLLAGAKAGWNAAQADDPEKAWASLQQAHDVGRENAPPQLSEPR